MAMIRLPYNVTTKIFPEGGPKLLVTIDRSRISSSQLNATARIVSEEGELISQTVMVGDAGMPLEEVGYDQLMAIEVDLVIDVRRVALRRYARIDGFYDIVSRLPGGELSNESTWDIIR